MSKVADIAMETLCARIRRGIRRGHPLYGMNFYEAFGLRNEKADDLPRVYITDYSDRESHAGGAPTNSTNGINSVVRVSATVGLQLVTDRRNGWRTGDEVTDIKKMGLLTVRHMLIDEIEKNDAGEPDCSLDGALEKPIMFSTRESGIFDLGLVMDIAITLDGLRFDRTTRSSLIAAP